MQHTRRSELQSVMQIRITLTAEKKRMLSNPQHEDSFQTFVCSSTVAHLATDTISISGNKVLKPSLPIHTSALAQAQEKLLLRHTVWCVLPSPPSSPQPLKFSPHNIMTEAHAIVPHSGQKQHLTNITAACRMHLFRKRGQHILALLLEKFDEQLTREQDLMVCQRIGVVLAALQIHQRV